MTKLFKYALYYTKTGDMIKYGAYDAKTGKIVPTDKLPAPFGVFHPKYMKENHIVLMERKNKKWHEVKLKKVI